MLWVLVGGLVTPPARAAAPVERRPLLAPVPLPDRASFDELLFSLADPERNPDGGLSVPSLSLAVRARAWAFVQPGLREQREVGDVLSLAAQDARLSELPAGRQLASLVDRTGQVEQLRVRELGPWLRRPSGPLQGLLESVLGGFPGGPTTGVLTAGAAALGFVYQFGTSRARSLGLKPAVSGSALERRVRASLVLDAEPHFRTLRADVATHIRLPPALQGPLLGVGRVDLLEMGVAAARTPGGLLLDAPWARLRGQVASLELTVGVRSDRLGASPWLDLETSVQRERFGLRTAFSHSLLTARTLSTATASFEAGPVMSGVFLSFDGTERRTCGLVGMATF